MKCQYCGCEDVEHIGYVMHITREKSEENKLYICTKCTEIFDDRDEM